VAASELTAQGSIQRATGAFLKALEAIPDQLEKGDPVAGAIAISGNNLACELEEKEDKSPEEIELMLMAAKAGRKYWEVAGSWIEVERAEYRLAMSYLSAGNPKQALEHARMCEAVCVENQADPFELFFAYEVLTKASRAMCEDYKSQLPAENQKFCNIP